VAAGREHKLGRKAVGYVDLRGRLAERRRDHRTNATLWHEIGHGPYFFSTLGFGLATPASWVSFIFISDVPLPVVALPLFPSTALVLFGLWQL
jgi:hypothetical protein